MVAAVWYDDDRAKTNAVGKYAPSALALLKA